MIRRLLLVVAAASAMSSPVLAKDGEVIVHQRDAGTLDASGFARAQAVSARFAVDMPCKFTELSFANAPMEDGKSPYAKDATILTCADPNAADRMVVVIKAAYDTGAAGADTYFENTFADAAKAGTASRGEYRGDRAYIAQSSDGQRCQWRRAVRHGGELVLMTMVAMSAECASQSAAADRFINSLEFTQ